MKITFLGTGSYDDELNSNVSLLIESRTKMLLDLGFMAIGNYWQFNRNPSFIDAIFISHFHADHFFGLPALLMWMKNNGRKKPIYIISLKGARRKINVLMKLAYQISLTDLPFGINFIEVKNKTKIDFNEFTLEFAEMKHATKDLAIKVSLKNRSVVYTGDGIPKKDALNLYKNADLLIHEAYTLKKEERFKEIHSNILDVLKLVDSLNVCKVAFVHLHVKLRKVNLLEKIPKKFRGKVIFPRPFSTLTL